MFFITTLHHLPPTVTYTVINLVYSTGPVSRTGASPSPMVNACDVAYDFLQSTAARMGANAVIGVQVMPIGSEGVMMCGTAVVIDETTLPAGTTAESDGSQGPASDASLPSWQRFWAS